MTDNKRFLPIHASRGFAFPAPPVLAGDQVILFSRFAQYLALLRAMDPLAADVEARGRDDGV